MDIVAIVISVLALLSSVAIAFLRWPRVHVQIKSRQTRAGAMDGPVVAETFRLVVLNTGSETVTISNVGLLNVDDAFSWLGADPIEQEGRPDWLRLVGPDLPVQIDGHGCVQWTASEDALSFFGQGTRVEGFAHRYRSPWKGLRKSIRIYRSRVAVRQGP